jgi:hypothetical protein
VPIAQAQVAIAVAAPNRVSSTRQSQVQEAHT